MTKQSGCAIIISEREKKTKEKGLTKMMTELTKLYVLIEEDGKEHYFATKSDRNYAYNFLPIWQHGLVKFGEIEINNGQFVKKVVDK